MLMKINKILTILFGASLLAVGGSSYQSQVTEAGQTAKANYLSVADDQPAPDFALKDINGRTVHLSDFRGKVVVLNFWATWCPPCRKELPDFAELQAEYNGKGLQFIGIATDDDGLAKVKPFVESAKIPYPVLLPDPSIAAKYGEMNVIPVTFLIDRKGVLRAHYVGMRKKDVLEDMFKPLLAER
jgi:peroxiredoxin